jgi:hypothetical protein
MSDSLRESVVRQFRAAADNYQISQIGPGDARAIADLLDSPQPVVDREALAKAVAGHTRSEMYRGSEPEWWCPCALALTAILVPACVVAVVVGYVPVWIGQRLGWWK